MRGTSEGFDALAAALADAGSPIGIAELHGGLCGVLCAAGPDAAREWLESTFGECTLEEADEQSFHSLQIESWQALVAARMEFAPLLPDDETALQERVHALALWCHGFVTGLALGGLKLTEGIGHSEELAEIVHDFVEISRAGVGDADEDEGEGEAAEFSFAELAEFVRVGVQIVFEEIGRRPQVTDGQSIH